MITANVWTLAALLSARDPNHDAWDTVAWFRNGRKSTSVDCLPTCELLTGDVYQDDEIPATERCPVSPLPMVERAAPRVTFSVSRSHVRTPAVKVA